MIVIAGAGITGLAAAYELTRRRVPFRLFEASPRTGGLLVTERAGGFTIDGGADAMLAQKPAALDLCAEIGLGPRLMETRPPRTAYVLNGRRLYALPAGSILGLPTTLPSLATYDLLSPAARLRVALEPLMPRRARADESVGSFFRRRFGAAARDLIAAPLLGGIHAGDIETLSIVSLFPRLAEAEHASGKVLHTLKRTRRASAGGAFKAPQDGMGELVAALERQLPPGALQHDTPVTALGRRGAGWQVSVPGGAVAADAVILAVPAHTAARLLRPLDAPAAAICASVPYVSTVTVAAAFRRDHVQHPLAGSGFVVAPRRRTGRLTACTWVSSKWAHRAPPGHVLLRMFFGGAHDPDAVDLPDDELVAQALREVTPVLGVTAAPLLTRVYRWPRAGAQHIVGHGARMAELVERLHAHAGLLVAGSGFRAVGVPDCVADGRAAAAQAADYVRMTG